MFNKFLLLFLVPLFLFSTELKKIKVQLQWKNQFEFAGFYMARHLGLYENIGLDVEFLEYDGTFKIVNKVLKGEAEFGIAGSSLVNDWQNDAQILLLANYFKKSPLALVTRPEIISPIDLIGKKVMIGAVDRDSAQYRQIFNTFGITTENTTFLPPKFNFKSFDDFGIDAYSVFLTNEPYRLTKNKTTYNVISPNNYGVNFNDVNLFTSVAFATNKPLLIKNFIEASNAGWKYALENIEESVELILKEYNTQNKSKDELLFEGNQSLKFIMPKSYEIGSVDLEQFSDIASLFYEIGLSKKKKNMHDFNYFSSLKSNLTFEEKNYLQNKDLTFNLCIDSNWMPFEMYENGKYKGISSEIMDLISNDLGIKFNIVKTKDWNESLKFAKARKCDILPMAMKTKERSEYMDFTDSYINSPYVLATSNKQIYVNKIEDILDKKIALVKGYAYTEILKERYPKKKFVEVSNVSEGIKLLNEGKIFGFLDSLMSIAFEVSKKHFINIKISGTFSDNWEMGIATRNDEPLLQSIMNKSLRKITEDQRRLVFNKWFELRVDEKVDYTTIFQIIAFFLVLLLVILLWNRSLRNEKKLIEKLKNELEEKNKELLDLSVTDQLTGTYNRRKINESLVYELNRFYRTKENFSLIILDIDFFKNVNDEYGHNIGDSVLIEFSNILKENIRNTDILGRWGGEEFILLTPNTNIDEAKDLADKLRTIIMSHNFEIVGKKTASFGVTQSKNKDSKDSIIERADKALYEAKNSGRNKVISLN